MPPDHSHEHKDAALVDPRRQRLVGYSPDGQRVDNVTAENAYDVNPKQPKILIHLLDHEERRVVAAVVIPNTRERPDVVRFGDKLYDVVTTLSNPPRYKESMVLDAHNLTEEDQHDATNT